MRGCREKDSGFWVSARPLPGLCHSSPHLQSGSSAPHPPTHPPLRAEHACGLYPPPLVEYPAILVAWAAGPAPHHPTTPSPSLPACLPVLSPFSCMIPGHLVMRSHKLMGLSSTMHIFNIYTVCTFVCTFVTCTPYIIHIPYFCQYLCHMYTVHHMYHTFASTCVTCTPYIIEIPYFCQYFCHMYAVHHIYTVLVSVLVSHVHRTSYIYRISYIWYTYLSRV